MKPSSTAAKLTFLAPDDDGFSYILFLCVLGSFLAHAGTFFLFQVVYPQRVTIPQPAPRVSLLTPSSPENVALLRWIEAEDPALVANDNPLVPPGLVDVHYRPSFASPHTAPLGAPAEQAEGVRFPRAVDQLSPVQSSSPGPETATKPPATVATSVTFSGSLTGRPIVKNPPVTFTYHASAPAENTTAFIGVADSGEVRFTVLELSSGDPSLDEVALAHLRQIAFAPANSPLTWGFVTYTWGTDAYAAAASKSP